MRIAELVTDSIVDGKGLRLTVFVQGCPHHCAGCHNPQTHDFGGGREVEPEEILKMLTENPLLDGITLSGGEPFCQALPCAQLAREAKKLGRNVWTYTGYTYEQLVAEARPERLALLEATDILVDGPFLLAERTLELPWRGSRNQRLIDMEQTRRTGRVISL